MEQERQQERQCPVCSYPMIWIRRVDRRSAFFCMFSSEESHRSRRRIQRMNRDIERIERSIER